MSQSRQRTAPVQFGQGETGTAPRPRPSRWLGMVILALALFGVTAPAHAHGPRVYVGAVIGVPVTPPVVGVVVAPYADPYPCASAYPPPGWAYPPYPAYGVRARPHHRWGHGHREWQHDGWGRRARVWAPY